MKIRPALLSDKDGLYWLVQAHADYEKFQGYLAMPDIEYFLSGPDKALFVVERQGEMVGYFSLLTHYATWQADHYLYLDCLYLVDSARAKGLGSKIMQFIIQFAIQHRLNWIEWQTPVWNDSAIAFYQKQGAELNKKARFSIGGFKPNCYFR